MNCLDCERFIKRKGKCAVFIKKPKNCWAFTTDKDWHKKVMKAVNEYRKTHGGKI